MDYKKINMQYFSQTLSLTSSQTLSLSTSLALNISRSLALLLIVFTSSNIFPQSTPIHISEVDLYDFIDELANEQIIQINSAVKPYSKQQVYQWLRKSEKVENLSKRQKKQIQFYLKEYQFVSNDTINPYGDSKWNVGRSWTHKSAFSLDQLGYFYKDRGFAFSIKPIWGVDYRKNETGSVRHFWGGLGAYATVGKNWSLYASLRDNSITEIMAFPYYFTQEDAGNYKIGEGGRLQFLPTVA